MMDPDVMWPTFLPGALDNISLCGVVPFLPVCHSDGSAKDTDVIWIAGKTPNENYSIIFHAPWPPVGGITDCPMASRTLYLLNGQVRQLGAIVFRSQELYDRLRRSRYNDRRLHRWRFGNPGVDTIVVETVFLVWTTTREPVACNSPVPSVDLVKHQVVPGDTPQILKIRQTLLDDSHIRSNHAELVVSAESRLGKITRSDDRQLLTK